MTLTAFLASTQARVESVLDGLLPTAPESLAQAMRYSVLGGGKRLRAALVYGTGELAGTAIGPLDAPAAAVELLHAYSLIHDDLPAMDDAALRRGRPACHRAFGEATAILAGDALQALAFEVLADAPQLAGEIRARMVSELARAAGAAGMVGGQTLDLALPGTTADLTHLVAVSAAKTGALIRASVRLGALAGELDAGQCDALDSYAYALGLAFQVQDDVLDATASSAATGKDERADAARAQPTFVTALGLAGAQHYAQTLASQAVTALRGVARSGHLTALAALAASRPT